MCDIVEAGSARNDKIRQLINEVCDLKIIQIDNGIQVQNEDSLTTADSICARQVFVREFSTRKSSWPHVR